MRISDWSSDVCSSDLNQCETGSFTPDSSASPGTTLAQNFSVKSKKGTYTLGINWQATPDLLLYATTRRGYRAGGFNVPKLDASVANLQNFAPETLTDIEVGTKGRYSVSGLQGTFRSEEHTSELQSLMRISYAVFCLKKKIKIIIV